MSKKPPKKPSGTSLFGGINNIHSHPTRRVTTTMAQSTMASPASTQQTQQQQRLRTSLPRPGVPGRKITKPEDFFWHTSNVQILPEIPTTRQVTPKPVTFKNAEDLASYICLANKAEKEFAEVPLLRRALLVAERWVNQGTQTYSERSTFTQLQPHLQPKSTTPTIQVPAFLVSPTEVNVFTSGEPTTAAEKRFVSEDGIFMPMHPASHGQPGPQHWFGEYDFTNPGPDKQMTATSSSSSRSVFFLPENAEEEDFFTAKMPLGVFGDQSSLTVSRFQRRLPERVIKHCVACSKALSEIKDVPEFAYMPEPLGVAFPAKDEYLGFGFLLRKNTPRPLAKKPRLVVPFFSLYSENTINPNDPPLLVMLIKDAMAKHPRMDPAQYILQHVMFPVIKSWVSAYQQQGMLMELHGQNTLLEFDDNLKPTRIVHRDLDNYMDWKKREELGLSNEGLNPEYDASDPAIPQGSAFSLIFDSSIGHHTFDFMADMMQKHFGTDPEVLHRMCQDYFQEQFPDFAKHFPSDGKIWYYGKEVGTNEFPVVSTGKAPRWRPSKPSPSLTQGRR
ncbi:MAG TPA: IucA/IucC family C-terminal-domain containing protein [Gammaproteobacteria bacterium]|nr:IucA/IucC family C-terminal-domain containing protein [Gammaproteobacteria bacterium]